MKVIFMEPETSGNIGALARAMNNFGFKELILINPQCEVECGETKARAKHAYETIRNARIVQKLEDVEDELNHLIGTTGMIPDRYSPERSYITPKNIRENIEKLEGEVGLLLGREGIGLTNEELMKCNTVIHIPTDPDYPVMNITHAATIILYELRDNEGTNSSKVDEDKVKTVIKYFNRAIDNLENIRKPEEVKKTFERTINKSFLQPKEANSLITALREINEKIS